MSKKYEFTGETRQFDEDTLLKRIRRLSDGLIGGWIESEENLSHEGTCFVYDDAMVFESGFVSDSAKVFGDASVSGSARISDNAGVFDDAVVSEGASVSGNATVFGQAIATDDAKIYGRAKIYGLASVSGHAMVSEWAQVSGTAKVLESAKIFGNASVSDSAVASGTTIVSGSARLFGNAISTRPIPRLYFRHPITISDTHIAIGCENHTIERWKKDIVSIVRKYGYSNTEIKVTIAIIKSVLGNRK